MNPASVWRPLRSRQSGSWTKSPSVQVRLRIGDLARPLRRRRSSQCRWTGVPTSRLTKGPPSAS